METGCLYVNRQDAAKQLARSLEKYRHKDVVVLGIPRGGAEIGFYVAAYLDVPFSILVSQKIPHPLHPEYGIGAISEGNISYIPDYIKINSGLIHQLSAKVKEEIHRRILIYHKDSPMPVLKNKVVILVDDGIATGVTMIPAIRYCHKMHAGKIIVAVPVAGRKLNPDLEDANEIHVLQQPKDFESVGSYYKDFKQLDDKTVLSFLKHYHHH